MDLNVQKQERKSVKIGLWTGEKVVDLSADRFGEKVVEQTAFGQK